MSLKDSVDVSPKIKIEYLDTIEAVQKGKKGAVERLDKYVADGTISAYYYDKLIEKYNAVRSRKRVVYIVLCVVLLWSVISVAIDSHNKAIEDAHDAGYSEGYDSAYDLYETMSERYEAIKDEYRFFHKYAVIVTTTGKRYHRYDCYHIEDRTFYIFNIENAEAKGYTPCLDCYD